MRIRAQSRFAPNHANSGEWSRDVMDKQIRNRWLASAIVALFFMAVPVGQLRGQGDTIAETEPPLDLGDLISKYAFGDVEK